MKRCRGTSKDTIGLGCNELSEDRKLGLCMDVNKCYQKFLYGTEKGKARVERMTLKITKPRKELEIAIKEATDRKGITTLLKSLKNVCHKYIRLRDKGKPCISCRTPYKSDFQAGHFYKAELYSNLRFNENNINGQCMKCNERLEGNLNPYSINLPKRIGEWKYNVLKSEAEKYKQEDFKWDREHLKKLRSYYNNKIKELKA